MDKLLYKLLNSFSVSGDEEKIKNIIKAELEVLHVKYYEDKIGNIVVEFSKINDSIKKENLMISAHMDCSGFIVSEIENNGLLKVVPVGNFDDVNLSNSLVKFKNGVVGKLLNSSKGSNTNYIVDIGAISKYDANKKIKISDLLTFDTKIIENDECILSPGLNNKIGCYVLLKCIQNLKLLLIDSSISLKENLYFIFTVGNQYGNKGALFAASNIKPDNCIVIDMEECKDIIGQTNGISLGDGPLIKCFDNSLIIHGDIKEKLEKAFRFLNITPKYYIGKRGEDGGAIHKEGLGVKTGELCIPVRHMNTNLELIKKDDVKKCIDILFKVLF